MYSLDSLTALCRYGRPPLPSQALYRSANFTLDILPARLAHRIQSLRNLPYIVVSNPHISQIHNNYLHSLSTLLPWAEKHVDNLEDEIHFTEVMADLVETHADTISVLAQGFLEARKYISPKEVTRFLDEHLRARIGTRLIAEQHIALHFSSKPHNDLDDSHAHPEDEHGSYIGVIDTALCPAHIIRHCEGTVGDICEFRYGVRPSVVINGEPDYTFAHIPVHLEYIITELLKNAFRATIERGAEREPIEITIAPLPEGSEEDGGPEKPLTNRIQGNLSEAPLAPGPEIDLADEPNSSLASSDIRPLRQSTPGVTIRIRDRGGGISPDNLKHIWDYSFTTFKEEELDGRQPGPYQQGIDSGSGAAGLQAITAGQGGSSIAGLGYGLPLGRAYAEYFGGGIAVQSMWGWGTDVYLSLRGVGKVEESKK